MVTIPFISARTDIYQRLKAVIDRRPHDGFALRRLATLEDAEKFLSAETPELMYVDFSDMPRLLEAPHSGLWLKHGGVIALCEECHTIDKINALREANVLVSLTFADIEMQLPEVLDIIHDNLPLLSMNAREEWNGVRSGSFIIRNNLFAASCAINLICNFLYHSNKLTLERRYFFHLPLYELLINAIEHGNCGISFDEKSRFLENGGCAPDLIQEKSRDPAVAVKRVSLDYELHPTHAGFIIRDNGNGFDWKTVMRTLTQKDPLRLHGRGILIARETARSLCYNEKGNVVTFEIDYTDPSCLTSRA
jgi:hypothetical protein